MPTGYTAPIADGIAFKEYAMGCARAFGALIMMRDEPQDASIPKELKPSDYYKTAMEKESKELKELDSMDDLTASIKAEAEYQKQCAYHADEIIKQKELHKKYNEMLAVVCAYESPSLDHDNFKKFMSDQIIESIKFDCGSTYHQRRLESLRLLTGAEWKASERKRLQESIAYKKSEYQKEIERTNKRNDWLKKLRDSLQ